jgi:hypothetical protein
MQKLTENFIVYSESYSLVRTKIFFCLRHFQVSSAFLRLVNLDIFR